MPDFQDIKTKMLKGLGDLDKLLVKVLPKTITKPLAENKVRPSFVALGGVALLVFIFFFLFGQHSQCALVNIVGFAYPFYASMKSIKSGGKDDDTVWLTYWVVYGLFNLLESITDFLFYWIPMYYPIKIGFLVWCMLPQTMGAKIVYQKALVPLMDKYMAKIDKTVGSVAADVSSVTRKVLEDVKKE